MPPNEAHQAQIRLAERLAELTQAVSGLANMVGEVRETQQDEAEARHVVANQLVKIETKYQTLSDDITALTKAVRDGSAHQPSLMTRMTAVETTMPSIYADVKEMKEHFNASKTTTIASRSQMMVALIGMFGLVIAAIVDLVMRLVVGRS